MQVDHINHLAFPVDTSAPKGARGVPADGIPSDRASDRAAERATTRTAARAVTAAAGSDTPDAATPPNAAQPSTIVDIGSGRKAMPPAVYAAPRSAQGLAHAAVLHREPDEPVVAAGTSATSENAGAAATASAPDFVSMAVKTMREYADAAEQAKRALGQDSSASGALRGVRQLVAKLNVFA